MSDSGRISGWLFVDQESKTIMFVSRNGRTDETDLPWDLLKEPGNLEAFRRDFAFKEIELRSFLRFKLDMEEENLGPWFEIREEPR